NDAAEKKAVAVLERLYALLDTGELGSGLTYESEGEVPVVKELQLITSKPIFYVANVKEHQLANPDAGPLVAEVAAVAKKRGVPYVVICDAIEAEIMQLPPEDRADFLDSVGLVEPGLHKVIRTGYEMLDYITYFTCGKQEV